MNQEPDHIFDEMNIRTKLACGCLVASLVVLAVLGVTLYQNRKGFFQKPSSGQTPMSVEKISENEAEEEFTLEGSTLTSDDLDFWGMYDDKEEKKSPVNGETKKSESSLKNEFSDDGRVNAISGNRISENSVSGNTLSENGVSQNGLSENEILADLPKNTYQKERFRKSGGILEYYQNNTKVSAVGIDVSKYQGDIDWEKVKSTGIDFAMIRMGVRGYSSGKVVMDENYVKNMEGALAQGIHLGIYFYSQAVSREEAVEEANYAVAAAEKYKISYPIVFYTEKIENDAARTDHMTPKMRAECAAAFCDTVKSYGYIPMIKAEKERFLKEIDLQKIKDYDWWLSDITAFSDFPYKYSMWQYADNGKVDGINGNVNLNISFVDYEYR